MEWFSSVAWNSLFLPDKPLLEIIVRGSVIYLTLFLFLRVILKRQVGTVGISDLLVIVLIADAAQNGMASDYNSLPDGIALVATLIFWNYTLEWLGYHYPWFDKLICSAPLPLIKHGRLITNHMRQELITKDEIMSQLRLQGIDNLHDVKRACMEPDGKISIIKYGNASEGPKSRGKEAPL